MRRKELYRGKIKSKKRRGKGNSRLSVIERRIMQERKGKRVVMEKGMKGYLYIYEEAERGVNGLGEA